MNLKKCICKLKGKHVKGGIINQNFTFILRYRDSSIHAKKKRREIMKQHRMKAYLYKLEVARGCAVIDNCFEQVAIIIRS